MNVTCSNCGVQHTLTNPSSAWKCTDCGATNLTGYVEPTPADKSGEIAELEARIAAMKAAQAQPQEVADA